MGRSRTQRDREKPYKGPESYQVEDAELFFGRDHDAKQLIAKILSRRFTLVHSPSGAGKTSLLNARIIPGLEQRGWFAIRTLPQNDPTASVRITTLQHLMPPPEAELRSVEAAVKALIAPFEDISPEQALARVPAMTVEDLLTRFDELPIRNPDKRSLIQPLKILNASNNVIFPRDTLITPFFQRLLRSSIELTTFNNHLNTLQQFSWQGGSTQIESQTLVSTLRETLANPALTEAYKTYLQLLNEQGENGVAGLSAFFENIVAMYGQGHTRFGIVLILDQFEEVYTRFVDLKAALSGTTDLPSYQLREDFFKAFEALYKKSSGEAARETANATSLPIRFVISMRDEYIARLIDDCRHFIGHMDEASFHLNALRKDEARKAIEEPAIAYGYSYSEETYKEIIDTITKENRYVEPAYLQIVCEKLWDEQGKDLAEEASNSPTSVLLKIEKKTLDDLHGIENILKSFFKDFLKTKLADETERQETLEMLKPLITAADSRNIVERDQLIEVPFRKNQFRKSLLEKLENGRIVRTEQRLGGHFVEITHEFLIGPIQESIQKYLTLNEKYNLFREALRELERSEHVDFRTGTQHLLSEKSIRVLYEYVDRVEWPDWGKELMFRSAIVHHVERVIESLAEEFEKTPQAHPEASAIPEESETPEASEAPEPSESFYARALLAKMDQYEPKRRTLSLGQLWYLNGQRDAFQAYSVKQLTHIVRSELNQANDAERDDIVFWTEKLVEALGSNDLDDSAEAQK